MKTAKRKRLTPAERWCIVADALEIPPDAPLAHFHQKLDYLFRKMINEYQAGRSPKGGRRNDDR